MDLYQILNQVGWLFMLTNALQAIFGLNSLLMLLLAVWYWYHERRPAEPYPDGEWPTVLVQLPVHNERSVVERLIDTIVKLEYPAGRLTIQVLDDGSTDGTTEIARQKIAYYQQQGVPIIYYQRADRTGYKAGNLNAGMAVAGGDLVAVFDADFIPPADFLCRIVPEFHNRPRLGVVQARWEHINPRQNIVTQAMALGFDNFFMVEQIARSRAGLPMNFNGSAGVWRRACLEDIGNWQYDTITEDLDMSYRAQMKCWQLDYRPDIAVPAELPPSVYLLKQQYFRWVKGQTQVLKKLFWQIIKSPCHGLVFKAQALINLSFYFLQPLMLITLILSLPAVLIEGSHLSLGLALISVATFSTPFAMTWSQWRLKRSWKDWLYIPAVILISIGLSISNTLAMIEAFLGIQTHFVRTQKFAATPEPLNITSAPIHWTTWVEFGFALFAFSVSVVADFWAPRLMPYTLTLGVGFAFTSFLELWQGQETLPFNEKG